MMMIEDHHHHIFDRKELETCLFPVGYKFVPTDAELLEIYLTKKNGKQPLPANKIEEVDLYSFNPWELTEIHKSYGQKEYYYFTPRDRKYPNGHRPNRKAKDGYWKAVGKAIKIGSNDGTRKNIGSKRTLAFIQGNAKDQKKKPTEWMMHEYTLADDDDSSSSSSSKSTRTMTKDKNNKRMEGWVLCRIYHNRRQDKSQQGNVELVASEMEVEVEEMPISTSSIHPSSSSSSSSTNIVHEHKKSPLMISNTKLLSTIDDNNPSELSQQPYEDVLRLLNDVEIPDMTFLWNNGNGLLRGGGQDAAVLDATMAIDPSSWRYDYY